MKDLERMGNLAKESAQELAKMSTREKNMVLEGVAEAIIEYKNDILEANALDVKDAEARKIKSSLIDRLQINEKRVLEMAQGIRDIALLDDPIGEVIEGKKLENGLEIIKKRVPLGVVAIIYEARPNVTTDAFALCFKTGNVVVLKGGSDAINTNIKITEIIKNKLKELNVNSNCITLIEDTSKEKTMQLMKLNKYVDVLIPRGGRNLIKTVVENSTIPVIETSSGNCHIYVDEFADITKALNIIENAKTQRVGVCNSCESLVIHKNIEREILPKLIEVLKKHDVEIRGDEYSKQIIPEIEEAKEEDFYAEYLDYIISIKTVNSIGEAIEHINECSTKHSESIITENYENAQKF